MKKRAISTMLVSDFFESGSRPFRRQQRAQQNHTSISDLQRLRWMLFLSTIIICAVCSYRHCSQQHATGLASDPETLPRWGGPISWHFSKSCTQWNEACWNIFERNLSMLFAKTWQIFSLLLQPTMI